MTVRPTVLKVFVLTLANSTTQIVIKQTQNSVISKENPNVNKKKTFFKNILNQKQYMTKKFKKKSITKII